MILHPLSELSNYIAGRLSPHERYKLERQMQQDSFLSDAIDGLMRLEEHNVTQSVSEINSRIHRITGSSFKKNLFTAMAVILLILIMTGLAVMIIKRSEQSKGEFKNITIESETEAGAVLHTVTSSRTFTRATPVGGYENYGDYLKGNAILSDRAPVSTLTVKIRFEIDAAGRPIKFIKIESPGEGYYQSAKKIITEGPKWVPASQNNAYINTPVELSITFRKIQ
jgi:hypothetical protein